MWLVGLLPFVWAMVYLVVVLAVTPKRLPHPTSQVEAPERIDSRAAA